MPQLTRAGLYFDEVNKLRVVEPEVATKTVALQEECKEFSEHITTFKTIADGFISMINSLAEEVEKEKMKAIGARNLIETMSKRRDAQQHQLQALLLEKTTELERLRIEHLSLSKVETVQEELIERLLLNH